MSLPIDPAKRAGVHRPMFGVPYVGWSPRPAKNGQPNTCTSCIPARKFGGLTKRIPLIWAGPKTKEQILEKWDPISKRLVKVKCECVVVPEETPTIEGYQFIARVFSAGDLIGGSITFNTTELNPYVLATQIDNAGIAVPEPPLGNIYLYTRTGTLLQAFSNSSTVTYLNAWGMYSDQTSPPWTTGDTVVLRYSPI